MPSPARLKIILALGTLTLAAALTLRTRVDRAPDAKAPDSAEITALQQALGAQPGNMELRFRLSDAFVKNGRPPDAQRTVAEGCNLAPQDVQCWLTLGDLQQQSQNLRDAAKSYGQAVALMPNSALTLGALAQVEIKRGRERSAKMLLERAAESDQNRGMIHYVRAQLLMRTAPPEVALAELKKSVALEPKFLASRLQMARISAELNQTAEMEAACQGALKLAPNHPDVLTILSRAKLQSAAPQSTEQARSLAQKALEAAPQHGPAHAILGLLALRAGQNDEAIAHLETALLSDMADIEARSNLAKAYQRAGRSEEAAKQLQVLQSEIEFSDRVRPLLTRSKMNPQDAKLRCQIGDLYATAGAKTKAAAQYEAALEIDPQLPAARQGLQKIGEAP